MHSSRWICGVVLAALAASAGWSGGDADAVANKAKKVRSLAFKYLARSQNEDGSYGREGADRIATTALVVYAYASGQRDYKPVDGPFVSRAVEYLKKNGRANGTWGEGKAMPYSTLLALEALRAVGGESLPLGLHMAFQNCEKGELVFLAMMQFSAPRQHAGFQAALALWGMRSGGNLPYTQELQKLTTGSSADASGIIKKLTGAQDRKDDSAPSYGAVNFDKATDPVVSTALAAIVADTIKANAKTLVK